jgi:hypothetical protein
VKHILFFAACLAALPLPAQAAPPGAPTNSAELPGLFDRRNLTASCVVPFDARKRWPEQRAEMLERLGFESFACARIIWERLKQNDVSGVGMVYNFSHGHRDVADFPAIWKRIQHYVVAVNVTGMVRDERLVPPSQGDHELEMLRTIQQSGWRRPVGLIAQQGGDAEVTLGNDLRGLDWLSKELARPGSGGERPRFHDQ